MPFYDRGCSACNWRVIDVLEPIQCAAPACPQCGAATERIWISKPANVIGDEIDLWQENGPPQPIHFRSRIERTRWMKEHGFQEVVRHVGRAGSDTSPHTTNWANATMDARTLENARILVERASTFQGNDAPAPVKMRIRHVQGEGIGTY